MNDQDKKPNTFDITKFTIREVTELGRTVRKIGAGSFEHGRSGGQDRAIPVRQPG